MEFTLLFAALFAVAGYRLMLRWEAARGNAAGCAADLWDVGIAAAVVGVFAGRLAAMLADGVNPVSHPADILIVRAGVATGWAALAGIATALWLGRRDWWPVLDGMAPAAVAALAGWHLSCVVRDACLGSPTTLPWGWSQSAGSVTRHPVEIYAAVALAVVAAALAWWKARRRPAPGAVAAVALLAAGGIRLATEPLRPALGPGPVAWYLAAMAVGGALVAWSYRSRFLRRR